MKDAVNALVGVGIFLGGAIVIVTLIVLWARWLF